MKHVSLGGLDVSRIGLGAMTMAGTYTSGGGLDDAESIRTIHRALDLGVTHIDTAEVYGPFHSEELVGQAIKGRRDQVVVATKFGLVSHTGRRPRRHRQQPGQHPHRRRGLPDAAGHRPHRPLLPAPGRPEAPPSRRPSARWPSWSPRARSATSACPRPAPTRSAAPTPSTRSPRCRPSTRCGPATPRPSCCRCCASSASASSPTPRSATASSPARSAPSTTSPTTTGARPTRASPARTSSATCASSTRSRPSPPRPAPPRRRSLWPGCSPKATTSPPSPAPGESPASRRTPPPTASNSTADQLERLNNLTPAAGERHDEANMATIDR